MKFFYIVVVTLSLLGMWFQDEVYLAIRPEPIHHKWYQGIDADVIADTLEYQGTLGLQQLQGKRVAFKAIINDCYYQDGDYWVTFTDINLHRNLRVKGIKANHLDMIETVVVVDTVTQNEVIGTVDLSRVKTGSRRLSRMPDERL
jgi:hypothetical protein